MFNTPYVISDYPERDFIDYLERERERARLNANQPCGTDEAHAHLMKYSSDTNHWNKYIYCACSGHRAKAIFLTGIPDIRQSLPHASADR